MSIPQLAASDAVRVGFTTGNLSNSRDSTTVRESAMEFEALLIGQLLEKLQHTFAPPDDQNSDPARDTVSSLGTHAVAQLLAQRHAFGIADMLQRALATEQGAATAEASPK
jgi:Rod binding domain-containing protein